MKDEATEEQSAAAAWRPNTGGTEVIRPLSAGEQREMPWAVAARDDYTAAGHLIQSVFSSEPWEDEDG